MGNALRINRGDRFGQLTVIREVKRISDRRAFELKCDCGNICIKKLIQISTGKTRSCGCLFVAALGNTRTHGLSKAPTYYVWQAMRARCGNPKNKAYPNYGGRGIKVCERWHKFENFLADMGERPSPQHEIDRIDNDDNYKPGNVRWIDDGKAQVRNRRKQKGASSRFRGVDWWKDYAWRARITIDGKPRDLGCFPTEEEAARAYDEVASKHKGYRLNFPANIGVT